MKITAATNNHDATILQLEEKTKMRLTRIASRGGLVTAIIVITPITPKIAVDEEKSRVLHDVSATAVTIYTSATDGTTKKSLKCDPVDNTIEHAPCHVPASPPINFAYDHEARFGGPPTWQSSDSDRRVDGGRFDRYAQSQSARHHDRRYQPLRILPNDPYAGQYY